MVILKISLLKPKNHEMFRMCGDLSLEKQTSISRTNMNPTTEEILPEKVFCALRIYFFTPLIFAILINATVVIKIMTMATVPQMMDGNVFCFGRIFSV